MTTIITEAIAPVVPVVGFRGMRGQARGFRMVVVSPSGNVTHRVRMVGMPDLAFVRRRVPEGGMATLEQAVYTVGTRRVYTPIARYWAVADAAALERMESIAKARPNINTVRGLQAFVDSLADDILRATAAKDEAGVQAVLNTIERLKAKLTPAQFEDMTRAITDNYARATAGIGELPMFEASLDKSGRLTITAARRDVINNVGAAGRGISVAPNLTDKEQIAFMKNSKGIYVRDAYGKRSARLGKQASNIIKPMLEGGAGHEEIAATLSKKMAKSIPGQTTAYWNTVADNHVTRARSWGNMSGMDEAGFEAFLIEAVLDADTTDQCRYMHGKIIIIADAMALSRQAESTVGKLDTVNPFIQTQHVGDLTRLTIPTQKGGKTVQRTLATSTKTGAGTRGTGSWNGKIPDSKLVASGVGAPGYHDRCRTTIVPT